MSVQYVVVHVSICVGICVWSVCVCKVLFKYVSSPTMQPLYTSTISLYVPSSTSVLSSCLFMRGVARFVSVSLWARLLELPRSKEQLLVNQISAMCATIHYNDLTSVCAPRLWWWQWLLPLWWLPGYWTPQLQPQEGGGWLVSFCAFSLELLAVEFESSGSP